MSLRTSLVLRVLLPLLLALGGSVLWLLSTIETEAERRLKDEVELVARALRLPVFRALDRGEVAALTEALRSALSIGRVYGAYVYGPEGKVVASYGAAFPDSPPERIDEMVAVGDRTGGFGSLAGQPVYSAFVPLNDEWGRGLGLLQVTRRQSDFEEYISGLRMRALGILLLGMGIVTVLVLRGHRAAIGHPLARLSESMTRVGAGDVGHRADPSGPNELAMVTRTFNQMLDRLEEAANALDRKQRQQQMLQAKLASAEKLAAVGEVASGMAHELGSPLSVVDGEAQRMLRKSDGGNQRGEALHTIRQQVRRMEAIIRQLMDFGKAGGGRRRSTSVDRIIQGAISAATEVARRTGTHLERTREGDDVALPLEARRMEEALTNLIRNACQATPGGRVRVTRATLPESVRVHIDDDGPGVPAELRSRIREPFFTTKPAGEGSGLGLAVAHGMVEQHGGCIDVGDSPLGGARFTVFLPLAGADQHGP